MFRPRQTRRQVSATEKARKFYEIRGEFAEVWGKYNFAQIGEKCTETAKIGGNSKFVVND